MVFAISSLFVPYNLFDPPRLALVPLQMYPTAVLSHPLLFLLFCQAHCLSRRFLLLAPKDKDHYNPIMDLEKSLYTLIECTLALSTILNSNSNPI